MSLEKRSASSNIYLEAKHYCLWRGLKQATSDCESVEVTNPKTGQVSTKFGYIYDTVSGWATKLEKYDTGDKYSVRYFGFKLHLTDDEHTYVLDMPYHSQILRRFLRIAPNVAWNLPLSITVFKGGKKEGSSSSESTAVWFRQQQETVRHYYTKDMLNGMPEAVWDDDVQKWDFRAQHRWLVQQLMQNTAPAIDAAAKQKPAGAEPTPPDGPDSPYSDHDEALADLGVSDDDLPF